MKLVVTVVGVDRVGIIAGVSTVLTPAMIPTRSTPTTVTTNFITSPFLSTTNYLTHMGHSINYINILYHIYYFSTVKSS